MTLIVAYDAYGNNLGFDAANALTTLLYSGEQFDQRIAMQYLRARYYDAAAGRFNRLDPFFGNLTDPRSLHKYLYTAQDPVNYADPSGLVSILTLCIRLHLGISRAISVSIPYLYVGWKAAAIWTTTYGVLMIIEDALFGRASPSTEFGFNLGIYAMQILSLLTTAAVLYPRTPTRLDDSGGLRWGAQQVHRLAGNHPKSRQLSTVVIVEAETNGVRQYYATGSSARLTLTQKEKLVELGVPEKNIFRGPQYLVAGENANHGERILERNLPAGSRIIRWGISWGEWPKIDNQSLPFPCPDCTPTVVDSGGDIEVSSGFVRPPF